MVGIVPYAHDGMIKRIVLALLALGCLAMSGMAEASRMVDLTALDCYVRPGSSLEWSFYPPDPKDGQWLVVPATPGNRPVIVQNLAIPGKAPANPYALRAGKAETYSFVLRVRSQRGTPGLVIRRRPLSRGSGQGLGNLPQWPAAFQRGLP